MYAIYWSTTARILSRLFLSIPEFALALSFAASAQTPPLITGAASPAAEQPHYGNSIKFAGLVSFSGSNGNYPFGNLVQGFDGSLYGTTLFANNYNGNLYSVSPTGTLDVIYNFCAQTNCADGDFPSEGGLALGVDGDIYGSTESGGASTISGPCAPYGCGTIFQITPGGALTTLYNFCSQPNCTDGDIDYGGLVRGADGNFYGTTPGQGFNDNPLCSGGLLGIGCGTVFKITAEGAFTTIYSFCSQPNCTDGDTPNTGLVGGMDGNLYGITSGGGANGDGTVFQISPGGMFTTLHSFDGTDGYCPYQCAPMVQSPSGNLYGTTTNGGANNDNGTVFQIGPGGVFTTIYNFCAQTNCADGNYPWALVYGADGDLYGEATGGGEGFGLLYKLTPNGLLTTLHSFDGVNNQYPGGNQPFGLNQATNGTLYGVTAYGGLENDGTVFSLAVGLSPFVENVAGSGKVGAQVDILGNNMTDATSVSFNGTAAAFEVISNSLISATVPVGATTGFTSVTISGKTLKSNMRFRVEH